MTTLEAVRTALGQLRDERRAQPIAFEQPPQVLDYSIDPNLLRDSLFAAASVIDEKASEISLTVANVEVDAGDDLEGDGPLPGKYLGLTLRWPGTRTPKVPDALRDLLKDSKSYAYAVYRDGVASITVLFRDMGEAKHARSGGSRV